MRTAFQAAELLEQRAGEYQTDARHAATLGHNEEANVLALTAHNLNKLAAEIRDAALSYWLDTEPEMGVWK